MGTLGQTPDGGARQAAYDRLGEVPIRIGQAARAPVDEDAWSAPLESIDVSDPRRFQNDTVLPYFARLRRDDPVHFTRNDAYGAFWSVTRHQDIVWVDTHHDVFSSAGGISLRDTPPRGLRSGFISMDPPQHGEQRKAVSRIASGPNLVRLEGIIRSRVGRLLDDLPCGQTFDWVDRVSIELTSQTLATLFDFPFEDRRLLPWWSDVATADFRAGGPIDSEPARQAVLAECLAYFTRLWNERVNAPPREDLVSMLAHSPATRHMTPLEFLGMLTLLIVGGNDTTRNSISGGVLFLNDNPAQYDRLRADPSLIASMVPEIIRYQTPLAYMRRTALRDVELAGKRIREGEKLAMWYVSGNRDAAAVDRPDEFIIDRPRARQHLSFGFGIHHCMGNRIAELQLRVLWEEILQRFEAVELQARPTRTYSNFVRGFASMPVRVLARRR